METSTRPRKVLFVITKSNFGGAQKYVYEIARELSQDPSYDVAATFGGHGTMAEKLMQADVRIRQWHSLENNFSILQMVSNIKELVAIIHEEKPDVIHTNSSKAGLFGSFAGRFFSDAKVIFTSHGWPFNEDRPFPVRALLWLGMAVTVLLSHKTIAVSKKVKEETPLYPLVKDRIEQIYFGIPQYDLLENRAARDVLGIEGGDETIHIGTIAELHPNKGYQHALSAIRNLVFNDNLNIHYHIIGDGKDEEKIRNIIRKFHLEPYVTLHGFIQDAARYLKAFDIFLLTSTTEALGFVTLEAGNAHVPVVATRVGGIPEAIEHEKTGLLADSKDTKMIKDNLKRLILNKDLREKLGESLYKSVQEKFTLEKTIEKTKRVYAQ